MFKKITLLGVLILLCLNFSAMAQEKLKGRVVDAQGQQPLVGALIKIKTPAKTVISNNEGYFEFNLPKGTYELQVQYLAYGTKELLLQLPQNEPLLLQLNANENNLQEVQVVSTGYQTLPKERATGSFVLIDSALLNRSVGTNILDRLDGVTSGLLTTKSTLAGVEDKLMIRGRSTLFAEEEPLIILDNFPYEGSINNINPNDIKTITVLKDAAAASIWGSRAGNGVIVITTHQGKYETRTQIDFNSNLTLRPKPDLYQAPWMANEQWIEIEQFLFNQGAYNATLNNGYGVVSPAIEIMHQKRSGLISTADSLERINQLKAADIRKEMLDRLYRMGINQQHSLSIKGGGANHTYYLSAGHDHNRGNQFVDSYQRTTLTANQMYRLFSGRLVLNANIGFTNSNTKGNNQYYRNPGSPYERLADENGEMLAVRNGLRLNYVDTAGKGLLLDWHYRPLEELEARSNNNVKHLNLSLSATVKLVDALKMTLLYQRQDQNTLRDVFYDENSFYARDLINRYSSINSQTGLVTRPLALGGIKDNSHSELRANNGRLLLSYNKDWAKHHQLNIIAGTEVRETTVYAFGQRLYGFNNELYTHSNLAIDFTKDYPMYYNQNLSARLDPQQLASYNVDRNVSYFTNLSYVLKGRYTLSASARKDQSNLFGVKPNQKGVPLWSVGLLWDIAGEPFYDVPWLQQLKLRSSYGYSGNVSKSLSAYLTATAGGTNVYGAPFNVIVNPPNPSLRWERVRITNIATDFSMFNRKLEGSVELYAKQGLDLFGESPLAPQTGVLTFNGNTANTSTKGLDISLRSLNLSGAITWRTDFQFSKVKDRVTK
ncbi:MAG: SusC/RagA family TonB-linked outer membrane protein [Flavobacteriales bacterium]|nr:MAG: SusC/RagA family TonB-linked outer membrane protein [Flavobacteriales bacterium]